MLQFKERVTYSKILVPLEGSKLSEAVLPHVRALAVNGESDIVLLRVPDCPLYDQSLTAGDLVSMMQHQANGEARDYLDAIARDLQGNGRKVSCALGSGAVAETILDWAEPIHADLIACPRMGAAAWRVG